MIFVPCALRTQFRLGFSKMGMVLTWRREGNECTATELAIENLGRDGLSSSGGTVAAAPCVVTNSLMWGEKLILVIEAPRSKVPGVNPFELGLLDSTFHNRRMPLESPDARSLGYHGHQATAYVVSAVRSPCSGSRHTETALECCIFFLLCTNSPTSSGTFFPCSQQYTVPDSSPLARILPLILHERAVILAWCLVNFGAWSFIRDFGSTRVS